MTLALHRPVRRALRVRSALSLPRPAAGI